jgi:hypothetical protein
MSAWEIFNNKDILGKRSKKNTIVLRKNGEIGIGGRITENYFLNKFKHVILMYDLENKTIGIQFNMVRSSDSYKIRSKSGTLKITGKYFIKHFKLEKFINKDLNVTFNPDRNILIAVLPNLEEE